MKKQEMHREKDQNRKTEKGQSMDKSAKTRSSMEGKSDRKAPRGKETDDEDMEDTGYEKLDFDKGEDRQAGSDSKKNK